MSRPGPARNLVFPCVVFLAVLPAAGWAQTPLWQGKGRIVVSADGNEHDHDDWAATPLSLALLAARGLQDKVPLYIYADHVWGSNHEHPGVGGVTPYEQMRHGSVKGGGTVRVQPDPLHRGRRRPRCGVRGPEGRDRPRLDGGPAVHRRRRPGPRDRGGDLAGARRPAEVRVGHHRDELLERRSRGQALPLGASLGLDHGEDPEGVLG